MFENVFLLFVLSIKIYIFATIKALCLKERLITFFTNTINIIFMKKFYSLLAVSTCKCTNDCKVKKYFHKSIQMDNENSIFLSGDDLFCL